MPQQTPDPLTSFLTDTVRQLPESLNKKEYIYTFLHFVLIILFLKRQSDLFEERYVELENESRHTGKAIQNVLNNYHKKNFYINPESSWKKVKTIQTNVCHEILKAFWFLRVKNKAVNQENLHILPPLTNLGITFEIKDLPDIFEIELKKYIQALERYLLGCKYSYRENLKTDNFVRAILLFIENIIEQNNWGAEPKYTLISFWGIFFYIAEKDTPELFFAKCELYQDKDTLMLDIMIHALEQEKVLLLSVGEPNEVANNVASLPIDLIELPEKTLRRSYDRQKLESLQKSIEQIGIITPLIVIPTGLGRHTLVAGERRYRAALAAQEKRVPAVMLEIDTPDAIQLALTENLQREDLNAIDETEGILWLIAAQQELTEDEVKSKLYRLYNEAKGIVDKANPSTRVNPFQTQVENTFQSLGRMTWESFVKNRLPLLKLPEDIVQALRSGEINQTKAKLLGKIDDDRQRAELLKQAITENLSFSELKRRVKTTTEPESLTDDPEQFAGEVEATTQKLRSDWQALWKNPRKRKRLQSLLKEIRNLVEDEA